MDNGMILQLVEITIAAAALIFGFFELYRRQKLTQILKTITKTYPGDVAKIEQSCAWAWSNVTKAHSEMLKMADSEEKIKVLTHLNLATGDTAASARMCTLLFNQLLGFQEAQFKTREITHPEKRGLALCKAEFESSQETITYTS
jgi:hypothetical protein